MKLKLIAEMEFHNYNKPMHNKAYPPSCPMVRVFKTNVKTVQINYDFSCLKLNSKGKNPKALKVDPVQNDFFVLWCICSGKLL